MSTPPPSSIDNKNGSISALQSEGAFQTLVESVRDYAIYIIDPHGYVVTWNLGAERIKGYKVSEVLGRHFSIFYPAEDQEKTDWELQVAKQEGQFKVEGWRLRKDGSRFWADIIITRLNDADGNLIGFGKIIRDLTEHRIAEQKYRLLVEGVTDYAIYSLDINGYVTSWNTGAARIKGYSAEEILGRHFSEFYTPEDVAVGLPQRALKTAAEEGHFAAEGWRVRKDGSRFWSSVVVTAIKDENGRITGFSKVTRDITDRKLLLDEIQRHAEELELRIAEREQTNAELEAFSYSVSHDLRAPLRAIEGYASALDQDYGNTLNEEARGYLHEIQSAATRMNRLVRDLLEYSRLSRNELPIRPVHVRSCVAIALKETGEPEASLSVSIPDDVRVSGNEQTLVQAILNLIGNGLKFHKPGERSHLEISAEVRGNRVRISVKDNGIGIAPEHQARIFRVFERLHGSEEYPGTGIGLAIVKRAAERMNGSVSVVSQLGVGSTFSIDLPKSGSGTA
jgi:PAS domain S-box-containing protein